MASIIPTDIIFTCILPKLPAKSLIRFKCVSKSFLTEISSSKFIKLHHDNAKRMLVLSSNYRRMYYSGNERLIPPYNQRNMYIYNLDSLDAIPSTSKYPKPEAFTGSKMRPARVVASCESYLLIGYNLREQLVLFNPSTHTYRELPINHYSTAHLFAPLYGMCHCVNDDSIDDYKIIRIVKCIFAGDYDDQREIMIYSLRTNTWNWIERKLIEDDISPNTGVVVQNHLFHIIFYDYNDDNSFPTRIGCLDMQAECWVDDVPFPEDLFNFVKYYDLSVLDGKLCFSGLNLNPDVSTYDLYIMNDYRVEESWVKLMSLPIISDGVDNSRGYHPIAYRVGSVHELLCRRNRKRRPREDLKDATIGAHFWYNLRDEQVVEAEFAGVYDSEYSMAYICKGSLLNFPGGQLIRASSDSEEEDWDAEDEEDDQRFNNELP